MENPFTYRNAAKRYAAYRPRVHETDLKAFRSSCDCGIDFRRALDVACGTGQSAIALAAMSKSVVGTDISIPMLAEAEASGRVDYVCAAAEGLPFRRCLFDVVSVALGFHWFDQPRFLSEANRVMEPNRWLVLYNSWFSGDMDDVPSFREEGWGTYLTQFPSPPRESAPISADVAETYGFELIGSRDFEDRIALSVHELISCFSTQSNVVLVVENGKLSYEKADEAISDLVAPFFVKERHEFRFPGRVWFLLKRGSA